MPSDVRLQWRDKSGPNQPSRVASLDVERLHGTDGSLRNSLIAGDNIEVMYALLDDTSQRFSLIYLDPPFFSGRDWHMSSSADPYAQKAYQDTWNGDVSAYLQWLYDRVALARNLLTEDGSLYLHLNWQASHYGRLILDELFGPDKFQNEIIWGYREAINSRKRWNRKHDTIYFYTKTNHYTFNPETALQPYSDTTLKKYRYSDDKGSYRIMGRGITDSPLRSRRDLPEEMEALYPDLTYRHYLGKGTLPVDYWIIDIENQASTKRTGYPTQKPEALLEKILLASTNPGDRIADFCCGSGTTLAVADRLHRAWVGCDSGDLAINTSESRLLSSGSSFKVLKTSFPEDLRQLP